MIKIGELAKLTGCSVQTIRFYEKKGLIRPQGRSEGRFRLYSPQAIERVLLIRRCRELDMSLQDIGKLLQIKETPNVRCDGVTEMINQHLVKVENRLNELQALREQLRKLAKACSADGSVAECNIIQELMTH